MSEAEIASTNAAAEQNRDDLVERLKAELAAKTEGEARANARMGVYEAKERASHHDENREDAILSDQKGEGAFVNVLGDFRHL